MDAVKKQIDGLIKYDCTNFDDLKRNFSKLSYRIYEGLTQMKETHAFSDSEISEINDYAKKLLVERFKDAEDRITENLWKYRK